MEGKSLYDLRQKTKTNHTFEDFPVGTPVKIMTPCQDFNFFYGETGRVTKNTGKYLGINVEFDEPRHFENGYIQKSFNFQPYDLMPIGKAPEPKEMDIYEVSKEILSRCGKDKQLDMVTEECAELIQAIMKNKRGKDNRDNIVEEIADVELTIIQLKMIFNVQEEEILKIKKMKLQKVINTWESRKGG